MSLIVESLYRQNLIAERNNLQAQMLKDSRAQRNGSISAERNLSANSDKLKAVNAQLKALDKSKADVKDKNKRNLSYFA